MSFGVRNIKNLLLLRKSKVGGVDRSAPGKAMYLWLVLLLSLIFQVYLLVGI